MKQDFLGYLDEWQESITKSRKDCTKSEQTMMCLNRKRLEGWRITSNYEYFCYKYFIIIIISYLQLTHLWRLCSTFSVIQKHQEDIFSASNFHIILLKTTLESSRQKEAGMAEVWLRACISEWQSFHCLDKSHRIIRHCFPVLPFP